MRFFRIPNFTGIEAHRDDADRGALRIVEGCAPLGTGGLRSGPVWESIGNLDLFSTSTTNAFTAIDAGQSAMLFASRDSEVHDVKVFPAIGEEIDELGSAYSVVSEANYSIGKAYMSSVGNRNMVAGDGSMGALMIGRGSPVSSSDEGSPNYDANNPDSFYSLETVEFPNCTMYVVGPNKSIFAAGNPSSPLTIYISEPAGLTTPERDSLYSTQAISTVDILMSNASKITALSVQADQVVVHTDAGAHLLFTPSPDQADDGYRVKQMPSSVASAAVTQNTVAGENGSQIYFLGHDGEVWKDESTSRGSEDKSLTSDTSQASWKAKGRWNLEHPKDLSDSFSAYEPEMGQYWVFLRSEEFGAFSRAGGNVGVFLPGLGVFPVESQAPSGLSAWVLTQPSEAEGPGSLVVGITPSAEQGPSSLSLIVSPHGSQGPYSLTIASVPVEAQGPTGMTAITNPIEAQGPDNLSILVGPLESEAPGNLSILASPSEAQGPESFTAAIVIVAPTSAQGPHTLTAAALSVTPTSDQGPTGMTAVEIFIPNELRFRTVEPDSDPFAPTTVSLDLTFTRVGNYLGVPMWRHAFTDGSNTFRYIKKHHGYWGYVGGSSTEPYESFEAVRTESNSSAALNIDWPWEGDQSDGDDWVWAGWSFSGQAPFGGPPFGLNETGTVEAGPTSVQGPGTLTTSVTNQTGVWSDRDHVWWNGIVISVKTTALNRPTPENKNFLSLNLGTNFNVAGDYLDFDSTNNWNFANIHGGNARIIDSTIAKGSYSLGNLNSAISGSSVIEFHNPNNVDLNNTYISATDPDLVSPGENTLLLSEQVTSTCDYDGQFSVQAGHGVGPHDLFTEQFGNAYFIKPVLHNGHRYWTRTVSANSTSYIYWDNSHGGWVNSVALDANSGQIMGLGPSTSCPDGGNWTGVAVNVYQT